MAVDALFGVHFQGNGSCHYTNIDLIPVNNLQSETCYLHLETIHTEYRGLSFITWCNDNHWRSTSTKSMSLCWTTAVYLLVCTFTKTKPNSLFLVFTTQSLKLILHIVKHGSFRHTCSSVYSFQVGSVTNSVSDQMWNIVTISLLFLSYGVVWGPEKCWPFDVKCNHFIILAC